MTDPLGSTADLDAAADLVELSLPLAPRHAATARVVGASLAADHGFSADDIDDLRLGINEAVAVLADELDPDDATARLHVSFRATSGQIEIELRRAASGPAPELDELAGRILRAVVDHHEYRDGTFHLTKGATALDADAAGDDD